MWNLWNVTKAFPCHCKSTKIFHVSCGIFGKATARVTIGLCQKIDILGPVKISHSKDSTFTAGICLVSVGLGTHRAGGWWAITVSMLSQSWHVYHFWYRSWRVLTAVSTGPNSKWNLSSIIVSLCTRASWAPSEQDLYEQSSRFCPCAIPYPRSLVFQMPM